MQPASHTILTVGHGDLGHRRMFLTFVARLMSTLPALLTRAAPDAAGTPGINPLKSAVALDDAELTQPASWPW